MGSPLSPIVANIFLNHFEVLHLRNCPANIKPQLYRRYLDDTFIIFENENQALQFYTYINSKHPNIKFTFEGEIERKLPFLDVTVTRNVGSYETSVFRKKNLYRTRY